MILKKSLELLVIIRRRLGQAGALAALMLISSLAGCTGSAPTTITASAIPPGVAGVPLSRAKLAAVQFGKSEVHKIDPAWGFLGTQSGAFKLHSERGLFLLIGKQNEAITSWKCRALFKSEYAQACMDVSHRKTRIFHCEKEPGLGNLEPPVEWVDASFFLNDQARTPLCASRHFLLTIVSRWAPGIPACDNERGAYVLAHLDDEGSIATPGKEIQRHGGVCIAAEEFDGRLFLAFDISNASPPSIVLVSHGSDGVMREEARIQSEVDSSTCGFSNQENSIQFAWMSLGGNLGTWRNGRASLMTPPARIIRSFFVRGENSSAICGADDQFKWHLFPLGDPGKTPRAPIDLPSEFYLFGTARPGQVSLVSRDGTDFVEEIYDTER